MLLDISDMRKQNVYVWTYKSQCYIWRHAEVTEYKLPRCEIEALFNEQTWKCNMSSSEIVIIKGDPLNFHFHKWSSNIFNFTESPKKKKKKKKSINPYLVEIQLF